VNEIAAAARVSPATVYAVNGGKQGLLRTLVDDWSADAPIIAEARAHIETLDDPAEILRYLTKVTGEMRRDYGDIMKLVIATAPHDPTAAEGFALATSRWRSFFEECVAPRLNDLGGLRQDIDPDTARDILWLYLGYAGYFTLVEDNGWSYDRAETWLYDAVRQALLRPEHQ
jgi:AcrR family transcriptional regulator